jgi:hypothetical protein
VAFEKKPFREIAEDILEQITKAAVREKHVFEATKVGKRHATTTVKGRVKVEGAK